MPFAAILEPRFFSSLRSWSRALLVGSLSLLVVSLGFCVLPVGIDKPNYQWWEAGDKGPKFGVYTDLPSAIYSPGHLLASILYGPTEQSPELLRRTVWLGTAVWFLVFGFLVGFFCGRLWAVIALWGLLVAVTPLIIGMAAVLPWDHGDPFVPRPPSRGVEWDM